MGLVFGGDYTHKCTVLLQDQSKAILDFRSRDHAHTTSAGVCPGRTGWLQRVCLLVQQLLVLLFR